MENVEELSLVDIAVDSLNNDPYISPAAHPEDTFPALHSLVLTASIPDLEKALSAINSLCLRQLLICVRIEDDAGLGSVVSDFHDVIHTISSKWSSTLFEVKLDLQIEDKRTMDLLRRLLHLHELVTFDLQVKYPPRLSNDDIYELAIAWPQLKTLRVSAGSWYGRPDHDYIPSFNTVIELARRCPQLKTLHLLFSLDFAELVSDNRQHQSVPLQNLQYINVDQLRIKPLRAGDNWLPEVAKIFHGLLPNLDINYAMDFVRRPDDPFSDFEAQWEDRR
ncbi:hypothetical protein B0H21DRAFT_845252 [Amylocystis lapponica]|nr:hypothetical protein B0H21DRAFT_845252 [Amylocystis lapponica]